MKYVHYCEIKGYDFTIVADETCLLELRFNRVTLEDGIYERTPLIAEVETQLEEYFNGKRKAFDIKLRPSGTEFQQVVWSKLQKIPYGKTISYKELAKMTGNPNAARAVGMANNKNPIVIIVPCHRVVGINGKLVGYAGGLDLKQELLELERNNL